MKKNGIIAKHKKAGWKGQLKNSLKKKYVTCVVTVIFNCLFGFDSTLDNQNHGILQHAGGKQTEMGMTVRYILKVAYKCFNNESWENPLGGRSNELDISELASTVIKHRINKFIKDMEEHGVWGHTIVAQKIGNGQFDELEDEHCTKGACLPLAMFMSKTCSHVRDKLFSLIRKYERRNATGADLKKFEYLTAQERQALFDPLHRQGTIAFASITPQKRSGGRLVQE